jgi:hypothetical protein
MKNELPFLLLAGRAFPCLEAILLSIRAYQGNIECDLVLIVLLLHPIQLSTMLL